MQTVPFPCGHCGKLIAINSQHLGQQVRCPYCQQVVIAPLSADASIGRTPDPSPLPPAPSSDLTERVLPAPVSANTAEDIFSPVNADDDLFGRSEVPRIEMPPESLPPALAGGNAVSPPEPPSSPASTLPWAQGPPDAAPPAPLAPFAQNESTAVLHESGAPPWPADPLPAMLPLSSAETPPSPPLAPSALEEDKGKDASARTRRPTQAKAPWFLLLVFCPLLLYSIFISLFAFLLYRNHQQLQEKLHERFDTMPDVGDDPGVRRGKKVSLTDRYKPELATLRLPESLCTTLGKPLRIGDLQVTPNRVERKRVFIIVESARPEPCPHDSLVLYLNLKNLSPDYAFAPLDNYFDRYWRPGLDLIPPLTLLEVGNKYRCYGGPAHWYPRGDPANRREWVQGRRDQGDFLQPGEEKEMFVCTDGDDAEAAAVLFGAESGEGYHGSFLWRVRVRRGLVRFGNKAYSATAVIGVRFNDSDIRQAAPQ